MNLQPFRDYLDCKDIRGRAIVLFLNLEAESLIRHAIIQTETVTAIEYRKHVGQMADLWQLITSLWEKLSAQTEATVHSDSALDDEELVAVTASLARFVRNLVAGAPLNQEQAFKAEPCIRKIIYDFTSYRRSISPESRDATLMLTQMLSNIVTSNDALLTSFWNLEMEMKEEDSTLLRMLTFADDRTQASTAIFILNCTKHSYRRSHQLSSTAVGRRVFITLLDKIASPLDHDDKKDLSEICYEGLRSLIRHSLAGTLWEFLIINGELITPHQVILLTFLDTHLHSEPATDSKDFMFILPVVAAAVERARDAIQQALRLNKSDSDDKPLSSALDVELVPPLSALVPAARCSMRLSLDEIDGDSVSPIYSQGLKAVPSLIENIVELLGLLDRLLPRILWGKAQPSPHQQTTEGSAGEPVTEIPGFFNVKRELVNLIGVMAFCDRVVQDRLRVCGGIEVVLNMCIVDERNPFMRERAIFALKNILANNQENQALVAALKPMGKWDVEGILKDSKMGTRR